MKQPQKLTLTKYEQDGGSQRVYIFTSTKEVMFSPGFVCGFVILFVCEQANSKPYGRILMKFSGYV